MGARRILAVSAGAVVLLAHLLRFLPDHVTRDASTTDVPGYYRAAAHVVAGDALYGDALGGVKGAYIYPPPFAVAIAPLALLGPRGFQAAWYVGIVLAFWAYACALVRLAGRALTLESVGVAGVALMLVPGTATTMSFGNADLAIWALCAWALAVDSPSLAGVGAAFKLYPGWMLVTRDRRALVSGIIDALGVCLVALAVVGWRAFVDWFRVARMLSAGVDWHTNVSVSYRVAHLLGHDAWTGALALAGTGACALLARRYLRGSLAGAVALVCAMALGPICWVHYAPALLILGAAILDNRRAPRLSCGPRRHGTHDQDREGNPGANERKYRRVGDIRHGTRG